MRLSSRARETVWKRRRRRVCVRTVCGTRALRWVEECRVMIQKTLRHGGWHATLYGSRAGATIHVGRFLGRCIRTAGTAVVLGLSLSLSLGLGHGMGVHMRDLCLLLGALLRNQLLPQRVGLIFEQLVVLDQVIMELVIQSRGKIVILPACHGVDGWTGQERRSVERSSTRGSPSIPTAFTITSTCATVVA